MVDPAKVTSDRFLLWEPRSTEFVDLDERAIVGSVREPESTRLAVLSGAAWCNNGRLRFSHATVAPDHRAGSG
jgi:hypothetical protein